MTNPSYRLERERVKNNIDSYGLHIYTVSGGSSPRFAYTIGASQKIGAELIIAGAIYYSAEQIKIVLNEAFAKMQQESIRNNSKIALSIGLFTVRHVDKSWASKLMLGVFKYFDLNAIPAWQLVPTKEFLTADTPDLSLEYSPAREPVWRWLTETWSYQIPEHSVAVVQLVALQGADITEAARWEIDQWELFDRPAAEIDRSTIRVVPMATMLAFDISLENLTALEVGCAANRSGRSGRWKFLKSK